MEQTGFSVKTGKILLGMACCLCVAWARCPEPARAAGADSWGGLPGEGRFALAYRYSELERRSDEYDDRHNPDLDTQRDDSFTMAHFLQLSYGLSPNLAADLRLGYMTAGAWSREHDAPEEPAWGIGLRTLLWTSADDALCLGANFEYNQAGRSDYISDGLQYPMRWEETREWLLGAQVSYSWEHLALYGGLRYSELYAAYTHGSRYGTREGGRESIDHLGLFLGLNWRILAGLAMSAECRLFDVTGGIAGSSAVSLTSIGMSYAF